jgi:ubiquinone/menaquinone biosynthesis C-methylase UbiE
MLHPLLKKLKNKYKTTALFYDLLDYPWEREYRLWRGDILKDLTGEILEAGVGTGRNFAHYPKGLSITGIDLSPAMLKIAKKRAAKSSHSIQLFEDDVTTLKQIKSNQYDWVISTFLCCVLPDELQPQAIEQFVRVLKPKGKFKLIEMVYSKNPKQKRLQKKITPIVEWLYGARFDRNTLNYLKAHPDINITSTRFLKDDTYLLIEGQIK